MKCEFNILHSKSERNNEKLDVGISTKITIFRENLTQEFI